jgi:Domain of unknown function (DUF4387)
MLLFVRFLLDYRYTLNFDIIFPDRATYDLVRDSGVLSRASVCRIFGIDTAQITDHVEFDPALAIKFTIYRRMPSGSPGDADIFGSQQYGLPLPDCHRRSSGTRSPPGTGMPCRRRRSIRWRATRFAMSVSRLWP